MPAGAERESGTCASKQACCLRTAPAVTSLHVRCPVWLVLEPCEAVVRGLGQTGCHLRRLDRSVTPGLDERKGLIVTSEQTVCTPCDPALLPSPYADLRRPLLAVSTPRRRHHRTHTPPFAEHSPWRTGSRRCGLRILRRKCPTSAPPSKSTPSSPWSVGHTLRDP